MTDKEPSFLERTAQQRQYLYNILTVAIPIAIAYGIIQAQHAALWLALAAAVLGTGTAAVVLKKQRNDDDDA